MDNVRSTSPTRQPIGLSLASPLNTPSRRRFASPPGSRDRDSRSNTYSDRFIPSRLSTNLEEAFDMMENRDSSLRENRAKPDAKHERSSSMGDILRSELLGHSLLSLNDPRLDAQAGSPARRDSSGSNLFKYRSPQGSVSMSSHHASMESQFSSGSDGIGAQAAFMVASPGRQGSLGSPKKPVRKISKTPFKVLDAPALQDDYYLNLLDWSHNNVLSVALGSCVYLWSAHTSKVTKLCDLSEDTVTSIAWAKSGSQISVGTNSGKILIWDAAACKMIREMAGHENRVGTMAWSSTLLASGSRDRNILLQDIRVRGAGHGGGGSTTASAAATPTRAYNTTIYSNSPGGRFSTPPSPGPTAPGMLNLFTAVNPTAAAAGSASRRASEGFTTQTSYISSPAPLVRGVSLGDSSPYGMPSGSLLDSDGADHPPPPIRGPGLPPTRGGTSTPGGAMHTAVHAPMSPTRAAVATGANPSSSAGIASSSGAPTPNGSSSAPCVVRELSAHKQEVCGLKWSFDEKMLASGGNDNKLCVWDAHHIRGSEPLCKFEDHTAAVKAVAWSPHQHGLLASGGGTADRHIRFWNAQTNVPLHKIDTGSQVCNLMWSKTVNEVVSTHGYSLNQIIVWKYPSMQKIATLTGHTLRVLYLAMSPDGQSIVTGAGDETLRFWNVFPGPRAKTGFHVGPSALTPSGSDIR